MRNYTDDKLRSFALRAFEEAQSIYTSEDYLLSRGENDYEIESNYDEAIDCLKQIQIKTDDDYRKLSYYYCEYSLFEYYEIDGARGYSGQYIKAHKALKKIKNIHDDDYRMSGI